MIRFTDAKDGETVFINPSQVIQVRRVLEWMHTAQKYFHIAGHSIVELNGAGGEELNPVTVIGTPEEVAAKLNGGKA